MCFVQDIQERLRVKVEHGNKMDENSEPPTKLRKMDSGNKHTPVLLGKALLARL